MIGSFPSTTVQQLVVGQQSSRFKTKNRKKRERSDVLRIQYKVAVLFHMRHKRYFEKLGVNLIPENIHMEEEENMGSNTQISINQDERT